MRLFPSFLVIVFCFCALHTSAQLDDMSLEQYTDSLTSLANSKQYTEILRTIDSVQVYTPFINLLKAEAYYFIGEDVLALQVIDTIYVDELPLEDRSRFAFNKGSMLDYNAKYDRAIMYKDTAEMYIEQNTNGHTLCDVISSKGNSEFYRGNMLQAIDYITKSIKCFEDDGMPDRAVTSKVNVGSLLIETRNFNRTVQIYREVLDYWKKADPESPYHSNVYINMGIAYQNLVPDSAVYYIRKAKPFLQGPDLWNYHNTMANAFLKTKLPDSAKVHTDIAIDIATKYNKKEELNYSLATNCKYMLDVGLVSEALSCYEDVKDYFSNSQSPLTYRDFLKYYTMTRYRAAYGDDELNQYFTLSDSIENNNVKLAIDNSIFDLKNRSIQDSLKFSKESAALLQQANDTERTFFITVFSLLALLLAGSLFFYRKVRRGNDEIQMLNQELNHRVKNNLAFMTSLLQMQVRRTEIPEAKEVIKESEARLKALALIHNNLDKQGNSILVLSEYLEDIIKHLSTIFQLPERQLVIKSSFVQHEIDAEAAMRIGLMINELVTNSVKHVKGDRIEVDIAVFRDAAGGLKLKYADNGEGIEQHLQAADSGKSMGLQLIKLLRQQLRGTVDVMLV